jgi:hypothetical protein
VLHPPVFEGRVQELLDDDDLAALEGRQQLGNSW